MSSFIYTIMKNVKTYGEIVYYLYDGDKKEKEVSKDSFMNSKDVSVHHNSPKPQQQTTTSLTGKVIESFENFCNEILQNGPNLALNYNPKSVKYDGGDGPSATEIPDQYKSNINDVKPLKGNNAKKKQEIREKNRKKLGRQIKISRFTDVSTDIGRIANPMQPTVHAGGAMN